MKEWFDKNLIKLLYIVAYTSSIVLIISGITKMCFECTLWGFAILISNIPGINAFQKHKRALMVVYLITIATTLFFIVFELLGRKHL